MTLVTFIRTGDTDTNPVVVAVVALGTNYFRDWFMLRNDLMLE